MRVDRGTAGWPVIALVGLAFAQQERGKNQCSVDDAFPIAGTAGFSNALSALRTNASTWNASTFAERHALRRLAQLPPDGLTSVVAAQTNLQLGVTRVPVFQEDASYGECPAAYVLGTRPVDLYAYNVGLAFRYGRVGAFYSSSITFGYLGELAYLRAYQTVGSMTVVPIMTLLVPLTGSWQTQLGASAYAQDFVAGAVVDLELADLRVGYTQSRGWYASAQDRGLGLFASVVARDGFQRVGQARAGLERAALPEDVADVIGRPSVFAQLLPLTEAIGPGGEQVDLTTGNLAQEGIAGLFDVRFAYALRPVTQVHHFAFGVHDRGWFTDADGATDLPSGELALHGGVSAGFVNLPTQYYYGLSGGTVLQARAELQLASQGGGARVALLWNDPEQTALYPFSVNTLAIVGQGSWAF